MAAPASPSDRDRVSPMKTTREIEACIRYVTLLWPEAVDTHKNESQLPRALKFASDSWDLPVYQVLVAGTKYMIAFDTSLTFYQETNYWSAAHRTS